MISSIHETWPEVIFLAEAFTRPHVMYRLAKAGLHAVVYILHLAQHEAGNHRVLHRVDDSRPFASTSAANLWPNTPDILPEALQVGGRPAFAMRLLLAATLGASYGIYGPSFELLDAAPREPGSEEYLDSEKYELKRWDVNSPASLRPLITRINRIRVENAALQTDRTLTFPRHG